MNLVVLQSLLIERLQRFAVFLNCKSALNEILDVIGVLNISCPIDIDCISHAPQT